MFCIDGFISTVTSNVVKRREIYARWAEPSLSVGVLTCWRRWNESKLRKTNVSLGSSKGKGEATKQTANKPCNASATIPPTAGTRLQPIWRFVFMHLSNNYSLTAPISYLGLYRRKLVDSSDCRVHYLRTRPQEEDQSMGTSHRALR